MRLIDADALKNEIFNMCNEFDGVQMLVDEAPTIDAVPVVRCKDCRQWRTTDKGLRWCSYAMIGRCTKADDFCSYGERR